MKKKTLTDKTGEVRELTRGDIKKFRPAKQVLPAALLESLPKRKRGQRGVQRKPTRDNIMKQINHRKGTGGIQLNGSAMTLQAKSMDDRVKDACTIIKEKYDGKDGIVVWDTPPEQFFYENGFMKQMKPDGGMIFLNDDLILVAEGKTQGDKGNAIERWADNYNTSLAIHEDVIYITFGEGKGFEEGKVCYRFAQRMMELEERQRLGIKKISLTGLNKSYSYKEFDVLYDKGQSWFINNNFTTDDIVTIMEDVIKDAIKNNKE